MKKLMSVVACIMLISSASLSAAAATYDETLNTAKTTTGSGYYTAVITNNSTGDVVYLDQASSAFGASMDFLLNQGIVNGTYTITMGKYDGTSTTDTFTVSSVSPGSEKALSLIQTGEEYGSGTPKLVQMGFALDNTNITGYDKLKITITNASNDTSVVKYDLSDLFGTTFSGAGAVSLGVQINNVPVGTSLALAITNS